MNIHLTQGQNASVIFNGDFYEVASLSGYRLLVLDECSYAKILPPDCLNIELGDALANALNKSRIVDPDDYDFFDIDKGALRYKLRTENMMLQFKYKTKKALFKQMNMCGIRKLNGLITIKPMLHEKMESWSGYKMEELDYVIIPDTSSFEEIGAAIRLAFSRCKSRV